jgi:DNA-binding MarR family transcriptional regulator
LTLQSSIGLLIGLARRHLEQTVAQELAPHRIAPQQLWILLLVAGQKERSSSAIAERLQIDKARASRLIDELIRRGWLKAEVDPHDRRRHFLKTTPAGRAQAVVFEAMAVRIERGLSAGLSRAERESLFSLLGRVVENTKRLSGRL